MRGLAVVIPAYRAEKTIQKVVSGALRHAEWVIVVNDASPDATSARVREISGDGRVVLVEHTLNQGVGGAVWSGYCKARELGAQVIIKMDSDDQMDPERIPELVEPILAGRADYCKGNRFLHSAQISRMPLLRRLGNVALSFFTKASSGYWNIFDPTNGFTALHSALIPLLNPARLHRRYFFETSLLIELNLNRAVVADVYIPARYGAEVSNLSELDAFLRFPPLLLKGFFRRILVEYFIKDFSATSLMLVTGLPLVLFGFIFGVYHWVLSIQQDLPATTGTVMVATLPFILGFQLLLQAAVQDINSVPTVALHTRAKWLNEA
jgi:dolichol-phosphate mannosyltransferase